MLARTYGDLDTLMAASAEEIGAIDGIGPVIAEAVAHFFEEQKNRELVERLRSYDVSFHESTTTGAGALSGQSYVITGTLPNLSRTRAVELIETAGGRVTASVSKNTTALVVGEAAGSKLDQARALGIEQLDEAALLRRIGEVA